MEENNMKIAYDPQFLSKEEIAKIDADNRNIELMEHSLNSNEPKNDLILSTRDCQIFCVNSSFSQIDFLIIYSK